MTPVPDSPQDGEGRRRLHLGQIAPLILVFVLFAAGIYALYRLLAHVNMHDVTAAARNMPPDRLAVALLATAGGYLALIGYDWSALRYLGRQVPFRVVAAGGFLGYSFGNTIGISALSGGAVRYRIYSAFGLNAFEVAAVATFVALAYGFGVTVIGLAALAAHPAALGNMLPWPPGTTRLIALAASLGTAGLLVWLSLWGRTLTLRGIEITAPNIRILAGQLAITSVDILLASLTLWILLPQGAPGYVTFVAIFAAASMAGVASHVPGGIGVFESVVLASLPEHVPLEQAAAALLLFRAIYFLAPFAIAMVLVALNEGRIASGLVTRLLGGNGEQVQALQRAIRAIAPMATGTTAFVLGAYLLAMALMPSVRPTDVDPNDILAAILLEGGATLSAALGVLLILLAQGLYRRISGAFWLTQAALAGAAFASVLNGLDLESAVVFAVAALVLWPLRPEFYRSATLTQNLLSPGWIALILGLALAGAAFLFFLHKMPYSGDLLTQFSGAANTPRALRAAVEASALATFLLIYVALQPGRGHSRTASAAALERARSIIAGDAPPQAWLALSGDKALFFSDAEDAFIMYGIQGRSWIAYGDPVGSETAIRDLAWAFLDAAYAASARPVFYEVSERHLPLWIEMGLSLHKIGEEGRVKLKGWSLAGSQFKSMRAAHNRALREGLSVTLTNPPHDSALVAELQAISDEWIKSRTGHEKGFSVGRFSPEYLSNFPIALVRQHGEIKAFASLLLSSDGSLATVDLMRYRPQDGAGIMEFLFVELISALAARGVDELSLGMTPLAGLETRRGTRNWNRFGTILFRHGGAFYNFAGLRAFKQKFQPDWSPRFLAIPPGVSPLIALKDVALLIAGGAKALFARRSGEKAPAPVQAGRRRPG